MSVPVYAPALTVNPLGWAVIGAAGYVTYKAGKKAGTDPQEKVDKPGLADRAVKGAMKTVYRAKKSVGEAFGKSREKYSSMWNEATEEVKAAQ